MTWTEVDDVKSRWLEGPVPATDAQIETLLGDAEDAITAAFPTMQARIDGDEIPLARVRKVAARMVIRVLRNPGGKRVHQETAGPWSESTTYGGNEPGEIYLSDDDRAELAGTARGGAFMIDTLPSYAGGMGYDPVGDWLRA